MMLAAIAWSRRIQGTSQIPDQQRANDTFSANNPHSAR
jgi:hypothetical protein